LEQLLSGFAKDNKNKLKKEEKPKAGPKGNAKKMMGGKVAGYKNGGCVMSGRGGKYKGAM
jgi:hypothetical protein